AKEPVAIDGMVAQIALPGAQPDGLRVFGRDLYRTDRARRPVLEDRVEAVASVDGLPQPASGRPQIIDVVVPRQALDRRDASPRYRGPDVAERNIQRRRDALRLRRQGCKRQHRYQ